MIVSLLQGWICSCAAKMQVQGMCQPNHTLSLPKWTHTESASLTQAHYQQKRTLNLKACILRRTKAYQGDIKQMNHIDSSTRGELLCPGRLVEP